MKKSRRQFLKGLQETATAVAAAMPYKSVLPAARSNNTLTARQPSGQFAPPPNPKDGFTLGMTVNLNDFAAAAAPTTILEIPNILTVQLRQHDPADRTRQNYPAFKSPDGSVPVLEATLLLHSTEHPDWTRMPIGIPLVMLSNPKSEQHKIVLNFSGVRWTLYADSQLLDNDFPFGYPQWATANPWTIDPAYVRQASIQLPAADAKSLAAPEPTPKTVSVIQYWTPPGHNSWVGDVVSCFHRGRYHIFYLFDRRHHQSKFGKGAHYFEHLSTKDFASWTQHEAATPLEEQWECIGTGTPFVFEDKLCLSYGLHTGRVYPDDKTTWPAQWEYLKTHGRTGSFSRATTPGIPAGATYSVSADSVSQFSKSNITFHPCQNPSVYIDPAGQLRMLANFGSTGTWASPSLDAGWHSLNPSFPPGGDCTFFFRMGKFDYIIGGFKGLWSKPAGAPDNTYQDLASQGLDFYDGSNVPSICEIAGGRFVMAAWIPIRGWGGCLLMRELIQFSNGRIGTKWLKEVTPKTEAANLVQATAAAFPVQHESFLLSFTVEPLVKEKGKVSVSFLPEHGEQNACELQIRLPESRAQFGPGSLRGMATDSEKSLREGGSPHQVGNYAIENLLSVDRPFTVFVLVKTGEKLGGCLIDAEIAGQRTMISYRPDLAVKNLLFRTENAQLRNIQIAPLSVG